MNTFSCSEVSCLSLHSELFESLSNPFFTTPWTKWLGVLMVFDSTNMTISITTVMIGAAYLEKLESNLLSRNQMIAEQIISEDRYQMSLSR